MKKNSVTNLKDIKHSFFDKLKAYESMVSRDDIDPEELAQKRLELIKGAKAAIEDKTSPEAKRWYGYSLVTGNDGFPVNVEKGINLLNEAVMMRANGANQDLGDIYSGEIATVPDKYIDYEKALKHYEKSEDGYSQYRMALIYIQNEKLKDIRRALDCVEKSAVHYGNDKGKCLMAVWLYFGELMSRDYEKSYNLFYEVYQSDRNEKGEYQSWAAISALFFMGLMIYNGEGVSQEQHRGFMMIEEAASYGDRDALDWIREYNAYHQQ